MRISKLVQVSWLNLLALPAIGGCFFGGILLFEWLRIGVIADPKIISRYYFGSEAMVGHGGWQYASASAYAWSALIEGIIILGVSCFTFWVALQSKGRSAVIGCAIIFLWFIARYLGA